MGTEFFNGVPVHTPNVISKDVKQFYVSYNGSSSHYGSNTTALVINETSQFLILNGDHRKGYSGLETLESCLAYFYSNIEKANPKSEHGRIFKKVGNGFAYIKGGY